MAFIQNGKYPCVGAAVVQKIRGIVTFCLSAFLVLFHLYNGGYRPITADVLRSVHVGCGLAIIFLSRPAAKKGWVGLFWDIILVAVSLGWAAYFTFSLDVLPLRTGNPIFSDIVVGTLALIVLFEAARRLFGFVLPAIATAFLLYGLLGKYVPGPLGLRSIDYPWLITHCMLSTEGVFGIPIGVSAAYVFLFILFAAALEATGGGAFFMQLAQAAMGRFRGGPAKVAVVASACMGTISGSAVANVAGTGAITIPLMKRVGYEPQMAAAIEAVASSGGLIMPPIMGAAAFIMSELLGVPYSRIIVYAALPAILYYLAVFAAVDFRAGRLGLKGLPPSKVPDLRKTLKEGFRYLVPLVVLVVSIFITTPQRAAFWGFASLIVLFLLSDVVIKGKLGNFKVLAAVVESGCQQALPVIVACAIAGVVVGVISLTGLGFMLTGVLLALGGKSLFIVLVISMITSLVLGMGLPITACYVILAVVAGPALEQLGLNPIAAHLFLIYFGVLSGITPPVALAAYVGAGIAGEDPMKVAVEACKVGVVAFLLPYAFVYNPVLLLQHVTATRLIFTLTGASFGCVAIAAAAQGFALVKANWIQRLLLLAASLLLFSFNVRNYVLGLLCLATVLIWQIGQKKRCS